MKDFEHGSESVRVDFHLHTRQDREFKYDGEDDRFVSDYVKALKEADICIGVITNHNKFDLAEYKALFKKARGDGIFLLPGVELSIDGGSRGLHMLIAFNPDEWIEQDHDHINTFLDRMFPAVNNRDSVNINSKHNISKMLEILHNDYCKDFFAIFAHVDQDKGLLKECEGGVVQRFSKIPHFKQSVLAVQKMKTRDNEKKLRDWLRYDMAQVEGSDPKKIADIGKDGSAVYLKLGECTFSAVKYALVDHSNRVFKSSISPKHGYIKSIQFTGGKLAGQEVCLSPYLNTLIGIRGSGKSSLIEVIRWGLDIDASEDEEYKDSLITNVLREGGQISVFVIDSNGTEYEIRRINGESPKIMSLDGKTLNISIPSILDNPSYFGQKDLSASDTGYENVLLEKFIGGKVVKREDEINKAAKTIVEGIARLIGLSDIPEKIIELESRNTDLAHKIKIFEEKGIAKKLQKQTAFEKDAVKIKRTIEAMASIESAVCKFLANDCKIDAYSLDEYTSSNNAALFSELQKTLDTFRTHLDSITATSKEIAVDVKEAKAIQERFITLFEQLKEEFAQIKREIDSDNLDLESFLKSKREIEENKEKIKLLKEGQSSKKFHEDTIANAIKERNELLKLVFADYKEGIKIINNSQHSLTVEMSFKGDQSLLMESLQNLFKGTGVRDADRKCKVICENFPDTIAILDDLFLSEGEKLKTILSETDYVKLSEKLQKNYNAFAHSSSPNSTKILYHGKPLKSHSIGQRASALILFILSQIQHDIVIIDQPEDDLDNQVIYREFIKTLKEKKGGVQFIFATHNANIPVLGDSEKIIATEYESDGITLNVGTIDSSDIHDKIINIMEGGVDAFKRRNEIYTAWKKNMEI